MHNIPHSNYYEAIIQLRPYKDKVVMFIRDQIEKREDVFITKELVLKTGIDFYVTSQKFAVALGRKLKKNFKGELKITRTLYTQNRQTSKKVYRVTILFRLKQ